MPLRSVLLSALCLFPLLCSAASKEIVELQRDVALLQEQVRTLQRSQDERLAAMQVLLNQTLEATNKTNIAVAVFESNFRDRFREQERNLAGPVAGVGTKVEQMSTDFQALRESIADLTGRMGKLQQQLVDLSNAVRSIQAPPPPPPGQPSASGSPQIPAGTLYENARRDLSGGKADLALQQFSEYVKYYPSTDLAPNAQYYLGEIHYSQGDLDEALENFDLVLEKYPDNEKTDDALYMKGMTLVKQRKLTQGAQEFRDLIRRFPRSDLAPKAQAQLRAFGLSAGVPQNKKTVRR